MASSRLQRLRSLMSSHKVDAYWIPSGDAHNSEYLAPKDQRRTFISGFDGSSGTVVVTASSALLWTDGRYHSQAATQLDKDQWTLMKEGIAGTKTRPDWLCDNLSQGARVAFDPRLLTSSEFDMLRSKLQPAGLLLEPLENNLVDKLWGADQPGSPEEPVEPLETEFAGVDWKEKVNSVRQRMSDAGCDCLVLSALDDVAYLLNLRGTDIQYNPVFFAYCVVTTEKVVLFISESQATSKVREHLKDGGLEIRDYEEVFSFLSEWDQEKKKEADQAQNGEADKKKLKTWVPKTASYALASKIGARRRHVQLSPVTLMKAVKNDTEIKGFEECHIRDGAALCCYFAWLEDALKSKEQVDEFTGAEKLEELRSEMPLYKGLSFATISSVGPNAAIIHYKPRKETSRVLTSDQIYLVDSGGQYKDGTTDVTRTVHFGTPSDHEKECYTRVLKGHISLGTRVFPKGLVGQCLDSFARSSLWEVGLDYMHGTGHGVGSFLNVHEGPMGISWRPYPDDPGLQENMVLSNEPGYYEDGNFGVRLENLVRVVKADTKHNFKDKGYLTFRDLTLCPYQTKMIDPSLLSGQELEHVNAYHERCRQTVGAFLKEREATAEHYQKGLKWLMRETATLG